jgi:TolB-like protein
MSIPEQAVQEHLNRILTSGELKDRPILQNFLRFIVEMTLAGRAHEIKGYTVATQVFGRSSDFDPMRDAIVRVQAGRLRSAVERYYQTIGGQDLIRISIPKGTYVPIIEESLAGSFPQERAERAVPTPFSASLMGPSVAVMPLTNPSGDSSKDYFVDGLTEEMVAELARYQALRVIASHSTLRWKNRKYDARQVGRELGVRFLLAGSMRKDMNSIKISVWLVDTTTGAQIWGEQYRRKLRAKSLLALQEEIGRRVAARVGSEYGIVSHTLSMESRNKPPETLETYEALLRFYHYITIFSPEAHIEALRALQSATAREPDCGLAWSLLALLYLHNLSLELSASETPLVSALSFSQRGASLEPRSQMVRLSLANAYFLLDERGLFLREANETLRLNPRAPAIIGTIGWFMALYGGWKTGLSLLKKAIELNPYYPGWFHIAPYLNYFRQGKYAEACQEARQIKMPLLFWDSLTRAAALGQMGEVVAARKAVDELLQLRPSFAARGQQLISFYVKTASLRDGLLEGLRKAGLQI